MKTGMNEMEQVRAADNQPVARMANTYFCTLYWLYRYPTRGLQCARRATPLRERTNVTLSMLGTLLPTNQSQDTSTGARSNVLGSPLPSRAGGRSIRRPLPPQARLPRPHRVQGVARSRRPFHSRPDLRDCAVVVAEGGDPIDVMVSLGKRFPSSFSGQALSIFSPFFQNSGDCG